MANPSTYGFIFARGGSKGVPNKNLRLFAEKPLIAHTIETALANPCIDRLFVSTDSEKIAAVAQEYGAEVPFIRPAALASDTAPEHLAWQHAIHTLKELCIPDFEIFVSLPATCPLRATKDITDCIDTYISDPQADIVVTVTEPHAHPAFNMVAQDNDGYASILMPSSGITRRQDAPTVYELTAVCYVTNPQFILSSNHYFDGRVKAHTIPPERSVDIDSPIDFLFAEFLYNLKKAQSS